MFLIRDIMYRPGKAQAMVDAGRSSRCPSRWVWGQCGS